jgi:hypothetical protein
MANLTRSNKETITPENIKFYNSLGVGDLNFGKWLVNKPIFPVIPYVDFISRNNNCRGDLTFVNPELAAGLKNANGGPKNLPAYFDPLKHDPNGYLRELLEEPTNLNALSHSSLGYEKNPWYLAYVGVSVRTTVRHPFAPFGKGVVLTAKAFAQPFGGRIGPWLKATWPSGAPRSDGLKVDSLLPDANTDLSLKADSTNIPNYSRYPGDHLGLTSMLSLASMKKQMFAPPLRKEMFAHYRNILADYDKDDSADPLASNSDMVPDPAWIRDYEIGAVVPDLFDATYYSVEPDVVGNYLTPSFDKFGGSGRPFRPDIGSSLIPKPAPVTVADQINIIPLVYDPIPFYVLKQPGLLLTGWDQVSTGDYGFPHSDFAQCTRPEDKQSGRFSPGACIVGGRVGYSVKIVSKSYLENSALPLGGNGITGAIINRPPSEF